MDGMEVASSVSQRQQQQATFTLPDPPPPATTSSERHEMMLHESRLVTAHIKRQLVRRAQAMSKDSVTRPLVVGMQGPQGVGKTTITRTVRDMLEKEGLKSAVFSLDDIYLNHEGLVNVARRHPHNKLLQGRGQPGTHDMRLGTQLLEQLQESGPGSEVHLPIFDKSAYDGQGDRSKETTTVTMPIDVVLFEGWCLGFYPLKEEQLKERYKEAFATQTTNPETAPFFTRHSLESLLQVNEALKGFLDWYQHMHAFVQLKPDHPHNVFAWRLQTEHKMKARGKPGMTDEEVHEFVARYMPGYELFGEGVARKDAPWAGHSLRIELDKNRNVVAQGLF